MAQYKKPFMTNIARLNETFAECIGMNITVEPSGSGYVVKLRNVEDDSELSEQARENQYKITSGYRVVYTMTAKTKNFREIEQQMVKRLSNFNVNSSYHLEIPETKSFTELLMKLQLSWSKNSSSIVAPGKIVEYGFVKSDWRDGLIRFDHNEYLSEVCIPEGVETIPASEFLGCSKLTEVSLPSTLAKIESSAFEWCTKLKHITLPENLKAIMHAAFMNASLAEVSLPDSLHTLGESSFKHCTKLKQVKFGSGLTRIPEWAFAHCAVKKLKIPDNVEVVDDCSFYNCSNLVSVEFGKNLKEIRNGAFDYCSSIKTVTNIPDNVTINGRAFSRSTSLKITLKNPTIVWGESWK